MRDSFLFDLKEYLHETHEDIFLAAGIGKDELLTDEERLNRLWLVYQKDIEEYGCDAYYAYEDALYKVLGMKYDAYQWQQGNKEVT